MRMIPLHLCTNFRCDWKGSHEPAEACPQCGQPTYVTQSCQMGCSTFYRLGRNLRIRNTGSSQMAGQEGHVEKADIQDLVDFVVMEFPESVYPDQLDELVRIAKARKGQA